MGSDIMRFVLSSRRNSQRCQLVIDAGVRREEKPHSEEMEQGWMRQGMGTEKFDQMCVQC